MQNFAFLKTWPHFKDISEKGHILRNANYCIPREIKNFTRNNFPNLLLVCTATYGFRKISYFEPPILSLEKRDLTSLKLTEIIGNHKAEIR